ncbi:amino acid/amide ABC transporter membrane protein 1, HAAT family [Faunimonas pinastri]|uniref:Amino acid/amide ABC transporter membrane protein 1, HAAT family n=1 Tax=Faunimonas pinastri TaxID=1855383 RepID=A0A1H9EDF9_9HYPH|nr:branched-chain amino acid ABC transporter permease [Faunimonas pinastri]SEQ23617.1 amino acid/amide ABC transporter membrane protein 1, HAAT family [Faunimonas pinastri]
MIELLPQQLVNGLALGSSYALIALGLTLVFGVLQIPNFPHGELYMLGASFTYVLVGYGVNFWLAVPIASLGVVLVGILLDQVGYRRIDRGGNLSLMIAALAMSTVLQQVATLLWGAEPHTTRTPFTGILRTPYFSIGIYQIVIFAAALLCWLFVWLVLHRSRLGLAIRAMAQNRTAALLMGIELTWVRIATFAIGALIGGIAGSLLGAAFPIYPTMGLNPVLKAFVILVIGGVGNLWGAIVGGFLLGILEILVAGYISSQLQDIGTFAILVVVLIIRPNGLFGRAEVLR